MLPEDLYGEIVAYLWDDVPSLKKSSLTSRVMTIFCQKLLFSSLALRAPRSLLREEFFQDDDLSGTSTDFERLLARSPHIGHYLQSIHIIDLVETPYESEESVEESDDNRSGISRWLPTDKSFPLFAPTLRNLKAVNISYDGGWHLLTSAVLGSLIDLMRRPSLVYVRVGDHIPRSIFNLALAPNVKHLVLSNQNDEEPENIHYHVQCPTQPVSLESLEVYQPKALIALLSNSRVSISNLKKLVVHSKFVEEHEAIWYLLQFCLDTLEDFEITPTHHVAFPTFVQFEELIDLSQMVALKRFSVTLTDHHQTNYIPWLTRILSLASHNVRLEEICLKVICTGDRGNDTWWYGAFDRLLQGEFKGLKRLKIFLSVEFMCSLAAYGKDLNNHEDVERLRSERGVDVDVMECPDFDIDAVRFEQDVRWATHEWEMWTPVDIDSLKIYNDA